MSVKYKFSNKKYQNLIQNINTSFKNSTNILYQGRNEIKIVSFNNIKYVVKSFKKPNILNSFIYSFFKNSKAKRSYEYSLKIISLKQSTPKPIGFIEFYKNNLLCESFYICEFVNNAFEMRELIDNVPFNDWKNITKQFSTFTYNLHQSTIYHQDYSSGNILVKQTTNNKQTKNKQYLFFIVDVNRMKFHKFNPSKSFFNFSKLWANDDMIKIIAKQYFMLLKKDGFIKTFKNKNIILDEKYCFEKIIKYDRKQKNKIIIKRRIIKKIKNFFNKIGLKK